MQENENVVELNSLKDRLEGDLELFLEISQIFIEDYPAHIKIIEDAVKSGEAKTVRDRAHTMKGAMANLSLVKGAALAFEIEKMGRDNQLSGVAELLEALRYELSRFIRFVGEVRDKKQW